MAKVTFEFDDTDEYDQERIRQIIHLADLLNKLRDGYDLIYTRRKWGENISDEEYDFLSKVMLILDTDNLEA